MIDRMPALIAPFEIIDGVHLPDRQEIAFLRFEGQPILAQMVAPLKWPEIRTRIINNPESITAK